jgi:hypothetical protein
MAGITWCNRVCLSVNQCTYPDSDELKKNVLAIFFLSPPTLCIVWHSKDSLHMPPPARHRRRPQPPAHGPPSATNSPLPPATLATQCPAPNSDDPTGQPLDASCRPPLKNLVEEEGKNSNLFLDNLATVFGNLGNFHVSR